MPSLWWDQVCIKAFRRKHVLSPPRKDLMRYYWPPTLPWSIRKISLDPHKPHQNRPRSWLWTQLGKESLRVTLKTKDFQGQYPGPRSRWHYNVDSFSQDNGSRKIIFPYFLFVKKKCVYICVYVHTYTHIHTHTFFHISKIN